MRDLKVWMRVGDQDDYHDFDSIDEAATDLGEIFACMNTRVGRVKRYYGPALHGLTMPDTGLQGDNGVSFYWGDDDAQFDCEISDHELEVVQRILG